MTIYFVRWPMDIEADIRDENPICPHCEHDWVSLDDSNPAMIKLTGRQRRCPACGLWTDRTVATNAV